MSELRGKNIVGGSIQHVGTVAIGDGIIINNYASGKKPRDYIAELPPLPETLPFPVEPYRGLRWFTREEARVFFGRGDKIKSLYDRLGVPGERAVTFLYGQSGVGKSSLLHAGLMPRLEARFDVHYLRRAAATGLAAQLADLPSPTEKTRLVIIDQLEEIFTLPHPDHQDEALVLTQYVNAAPATRWLLGFRKEYLAEFSELFRGAKLEPSLVYLEPLQLANILEAIEGVSLDEACRQRYGLAIDPGVAEAIAYDVARDQDSHVAPALQILLLKLWHVATGNPHGNTKLAAATERLRERGIPPSPDQPRFTTDHFEVLIAEGGLLLDDHLNEQIEQLRAIRSDWVDTGLLLGILRFFTTELGTARTRTKGEVQRSFGHAPQLAKLIRNLQNRYLLSDAGDSTQNDRLRLAHDALGPLVRTRFEQSQAPGPRGLAILENRLRNVDDPAIAPLDTIDLSYVEAGRPGMRTWTAAEEQLVVVSRQRRRRNRGVRYAAFVLITLLAAALALVAWRNYQGLQERTAQLLENEAERIEDPAARIETFYESLRLDPTDPNRRAKLYATYRENLLPEFSHHFGKAYRIALSPNGQDVAILTKVGEGHGLQRYTYGEDSLSLAHDFAPDISADQVELIFSSNGQFVAAGGNDHRLHLWNLGGTKAFTEELPDRQSVQLIDVSPAARWLVAVPFASNSLLIRDRQGDGPILSIPLNFSPTQLRVIGEDEGFILAGASGELHHYNFSGELLTKIDRAGTPVTALGWSTSNRQLAVGTTNGRTCLFQLNDENIWYEIDCHQYRPERAIREVSFAPNGAALAVVYAEEGLSLLRLKEGGAAGFWQPESSEPTLLGDFATAGFAEDRQLLTFRAGQDIQRWSLDGLLPQASATTPDLEAVLAFENKGAEQLIAGTYDAGLETRDPALLSRGQSFGARHGGSRVVSLAVTDDKIVSGDIDGRVLFFSSSDLTPVNEPQLVHREKILRLLNKGGSAVYSLGTDRRLVAWDANSGKALGPALETQAVDCSLTPAGNRLALLNPRGSICLLSAIPSLTGIDTVFQVDSTLEAKTLAWLDTDRLMVGGDGGYGIYRLSGQNEVLFAGLPIRWSKHNLSADDASAQRALLSADQRNIYLLDPSGFAFQTIHSPTPIKDLSLLGDRLYLITGDRVERWRLTRKLPEVWIADR